MNMNTRSQNTVTVNQNSTTQQVVLSNPTIGYHTLVLLESLRNDFNDTGSELECVEENQRLYDYEKSKQLNNLTKRRKQLMNDFNFWSVLVQEWISHFPQRDKKIADIIREYYCDIRNGVPLRYIIAELEGIDIDDEANIEKIKKIPTQDFHARVRRIELNLIRKS